MGDVGRGHDEETKNGRTSRLLAETASAKAAASSEAPAAEAWNCIVFLTRGGSGRRECKFVDKARRKDREGQVREGRRTKYTASSSNHAPPDFWPRPPKPPPPPSPPPPRP